MECQFGSMPWVPNRKESLWSPLFGTAWPKQNGVSGAKCHRIKLNFELGHFSKKTDCFVILIGPLLVP